MSLLFECLQMRTSAYNTPEHIIIVLFDVLCSFQKILNALLLADYAQITYHVLVAALNTLNRCV